MNQIVYVFAALVRGGVFLGAVGGVGSQTLLVLPVTSFAGECVELASTILQRHSLTPASGGLIGKFLACRDGRGFGDHVGSIPRRDQGVAVSTAHAWNRQPRHPDPRRSCTAMAYGPYAEVGSTVATRC